MFSNIFRKERSLSNISKIFKLPEAIVSHHFGDPKWFLVFLSFYIKFNKLICILWIIICLLKIFINLLLLNTNKQKVYCDY